jgi:hypothetical protein
MGERVKRPFSIYTKIMERRDRRAEIRKIRKELIKLQQDPIYLNILKDNDFARFVEKNRLALEDGDCTDVDAQMKFGEAINFLAVVNQLENRLKSLIEEKNFPYIKKK